MYFSKHKQHFHLAWRKVDVPFGMPRALIVIYLFIELRFQRPSNKFNDIKIQFRSSNILKSFYIRIFW